MAMRVSNSVIHNQSGVKNVVAMSRNKVELLDLKTLERVGVNAPHPRLLNITVRLWVNPTGPSRLRSPRRR